MYKIHFCDNYGQATITCDSYEEYIEAYQNIKDDPECEDIWIERYNSDEGYWEA